MNPKGEEETDEATGAAEGGGASRGQTCFAEEERTPAVQAGRNSRVRARGATGAAMAQQRWQAQVPTTQQPSTAVATHWVEAVLLRNIITHTSSQLPRRRTAALLRPPIC
jgi:hypothetical protein